MGLTTFDYYLAVNRCELTNYKKCMHRLYIKFVKNQKRQYILIQLCHKIVIYVVNLVYIAYIHILIAIVLQWAFTNYCNSICANKILSIVLSIDYKASTLYNTFQMFYRSICGFTKAGNFINILYGIYGDGLK